VASVSLIQQEKSEAAVGAVENMVSHIGSISESTESVHQQSRESLRRADEGNQVLEQLSGEMSNVEKSVSAVGKGLDSISEATDEQRLVSQEVVSSIEAISSMAEQNNTAVMQTSTAAQTLENLAQGLQTTVQRFKV
jgi:methyl-accepting chemotaxis protein